jgi:hypothetical protein
MSVWPVPVAGIIQSGSQPTIESKNSRVHQGAILEFGCALAVFLFMSLTDSQLAMSVNNFQSGS